MATLEGGVVSFGFRLSVLIAPGESLGADEREMDLGGPIGRVRNPGFAA